MYALRGREGARSEHRGKSWKPVTTGATASAQRVDMFGDSEGWAFTLTHHASDADPGNLTVSQAQYESGGTWQTVKLPANDLNNIYGLSRVSAGEYWAIGTYQIHTQSPSANGGTSGTGYNESVLLHFADGTWTQYGR